ncbi:unnamed protein product [Eruca vesicaria subsp. sativa]|uniref:Nuclear transcription factor Y subunit n=1 Tax=Eruca vesicaria subsp. sativa TaxID=29727 RepID=A0ABC8K5A6_ERUVS|nr:unnamed protein product [Eruca vesicaria subsp. sativa]
MMMHESRHLHAINRPRECGSRFLNAKKKNREHKKEATSDENTSEASSSLMSEKSAVAPNLVKKPRKIRFVVFQFWMLYTCLNGWKLQFSKILIG